MEHIVYDDCWQLLQRFGRTADECQNAKFELFSQCWLEMQMQHIYSAQSNHIEVIETTLAALHVGKRVACGRRTNGEPFQATRAQRIGSIYLLYAIYHKQPTKHFIKIEVSPRAWDSLVSFVEQLRHTSIECHDTQQVSFIFWQLVQDNAFLFTALDYCQALDALAAYDSVEALQQDRQQKGNSNTVLRQSSRGNLNEVEELHDLKQLQPLCNRLCQLEQSYNEQMKRHRTSIAPTSIFSDIQVAFFEINKLLSAEDARPSTSSGVKSQLEMRNHVRHKAMFGKTAKSTENESVNRLTKVNLAKSNERRMSSATVFEHRLPDDVLKDLGS